ncbi:hypothetical protein ARMGADRAFT_1069396 [Armillaria gallica]|uniref:Uncharacterized protein n=1 Tax=Armillaria gallica TaxID=47427 RepID=A0A2H3CV98_ARMGA|nr:hypothetical protein ARMGADRAFT_1069503 [Armillaria gallica]PBK79523.1 hypothetical protein ARMGADRAFT_1069396 [Armillaria gallica]
MGGGVRHDSDSVMVYIDLMTTINLKFQARSSAEYKYLAAGTVIKRFKPVTASAVVLLVQRPLDNGQIMLKLRDRRLG